MGRLLTKPDCSVYFRGYFGTESIRYLRRRLYYSDPIPDMEIPYKDLQSCEHEEMGEDFVWVQLDLNKIPELDKIHLFREARIIFLKKDSYTVIQE
jgi:hypothetical protein